MSGKGNISSGHLFATMILFEFGTALVVPIGLTAEQGSWLAILMALPGGILLFLVFDYLFRQYPKLILSGYIRAIVGRYLGWPISLLYVAFFIYIAARNLREAGDLLVTTAYDQTPILLIHAVMIIAVIYTLYKGLEVFCRLGQIYLLIIIGLGFMGNVFILFSGAVDLRNLLPLFGKGWKSVLLTAYPNIFLFPFAELVCFCTILPHLNTIESARKTGVAAMIIAGFLLSMTHAIELMVLGGNVYARSTFPLFTTISLVNIAHFLQRLDAIVILTLIIGVFFKMSIYCYAAMAVAADLFHIEDLRKMAYPIGIIVLFISIFSALSYPEHVEEGMASIKFILPVFAFLIPMSLFIIHLIRKRFSH